MKTLLSVAIATLILAQSTANAATREQRAVVNERSMDMQKRHSARAQQRSAIVGLEDAAAAKVTLEQVGDPDSFGRAVKYLGVVSPRSVVLQPDCTGFDTSFGDRCFTLAPAPASTAFNEADLGRLELPAKASHSLLCFTVTPTSFVEFNNPLPTQATASLSTVADVVLENPVLNDPTLIDPVTGQPFGGRMTLPLRLTLESRTLAPGASEFRFSPTTRSCIGGLVSKQALVDWGLSEKQANQFFKSPITLRFGSRGSTALVSFIDFSYGIRIYGD
jgi:hypothetical protein